ncbi:MAG: flagellar filament capping protein FliD [Candidatus Accumulibacter sp.]|jgi:flagellar hook-associated protein 2|nr:flagellar filament capping protein FliD [Accumulibacter sp.]
MAISSATGLATGLDISSLLTASLALERLPLERAQRQLTTTENKISAMGTVKSAIDKLQEAAKALSNSGSPAFKGVLSNSDVASVTADSSAAAGTYKIEVERLASTQKIATAGGGVDTSSGGSLTISSGGKSTDVSIAARASLSDIAKSINDSGASVSATVVNGKDGQQLVLTGSETGEANQFTMSSGIAGLNFDPSNYDPDHPPSSGVTQITAAQNAIVRIDGIEIANASSNTINDAVTGVSLTLKSTTSAPTQLTVSSDSTDLEAKLKTFVDAYNTARVTMQTLSKYNATGTSGALNGDGTVSNAINELRGLLSNVPAGASGAYQSLAELGVETNGSGVLSINSDKLKSALQADSASATQTIAAYGSSFEATTSRMNGDNGLITNRLSGLNSTTRSLNDTISAQERRLAVVQARYEKQFSNMELVVASMTSTGNFLTQQLASLSKLINS